MTAPEAMLSFIAVRDHRLMHRINRWRPPRWIRWWMIYATRSGDGWLWYALALCLWLFGGEAGPVAVAAGSLSAIAGVATFWVLKRLTGRRRPCAFARHCWSTLLPPDQFSFPSGHTITAFAVTVPVGCFYPAWQGLLGFLAISVAASRVLLGMHFLSDVVVGSLIGSSLGYWSYCLLS